MRRKMVMEDIFRKWKERPKDQTSLIGSEYYKHSSVFIPFNELNSEWHILFQKRSMNVRQGGEICFPGGILDKALDRTFEETAVRETCEELGITPDKIEVRENIGILVAVMGLVVHVFAGKLNVHSLNELSTEKKEVEKVFTIPAPYFIRNRPEIFHVRVEAQPSFTDKDGSEVILLPSKDLGLPEYYHKPWGGFKSIIFVYRTEHGMIWGITAQIIHALLNPD
jgi:8-oxo-dGTP pyrophosphatase MutT (NUDIX family)